MAWAALVRGTPADLVVDELLFILHLTGRGARGRLAFDILNEHSPVPMRRPLILGAILAGFAALFLAIRGVRAPLDPPPGLPDPAEPPPAAEPARATRAAAG